MSLSQFKKILFSSGVLEVMRMILTSWLFLENSFNSGYRVWQAWQEWFEKTKIVEFSMSDSSDALPPCSSISSTSIISLSINSWNSFARTLVFSFRKNAFNYWTPWKFKIENSVCAINRITIVPNKTISRLITFSLFLPSISAPSCVNMSLNNITLLVEEMSHLNKKR